MRRGYRALVYFLEEQSFFFAEQAGLGEVERREEGGAEERVVPVEDDDC